MVRERFPDDPDLSFKVVVVGDVANEAIIALCQRIGEHNNRPGPINLVNDDFIVIRKDVDGLQVRVFFWCLSNAFSAVARHAHRDGAGQQHTHTLCWVWGVFAHTGWLNDTRYRIYRGFYRRTSAVLLLFDTGSRESFLACRRHYSEAMRLTEDTLYVCCGLIGTGAGGDTARAGDGDAAGEGGRAVSQEEARQQSEAMEADYFEVDLGVDDGRVDTLLDALIQRMIERKGLPVYLNENL